MQRLNTASRARSDQSLLVRVAWGLGSIAGFLLFWEVMALIIQHRHLPTPTVVFSAMMRELASGELLYHIGVTLYRVVIAFAVAMLIGSSIGIFLGRNARADRFFDSWLILFLNLPALVIIILCYVWFGRTEVAAITAVAVNKIPNVAVTVREGARSLSRDLAEMAHMYRFGRWKTLRHVTLPQLAPFFLASARTGLSLVWKIVLVVELLGRSNGVGFQLGTYFQMFDVSMILAYALAFIILVQLIEFGILQPIAARVNRWRR
ncbi:MAG: ABC transporter permease [Hyphomicrobium zavarzinii]|uniref:ABC transporter permease n=1 Tax=Hyphomicrobium TaxID=81 RepID=UPI0009FF85AA|nr:MULTISPECIES: ABC transporter permease [Hyphomicrobium]MBL8844866.1 ABC transporter permease [Hyphomicrobium zavarzinii]WBT36815.1 ABC transporter permease [Hyphomicrobium sp. DMF-1]